MEDNRKITIGKLIRIEASRLAYKELKEKNEELKEKDNELNALKKKSRDWNNEKK